MKDSFIFNIPHSSTNMPFFDGYIDNSYLKEIELLTDFGTDQIFDVPDTPKLVCDFSRVFCDVERFPDSREVMEKYGMGFCYTHTDSGLIMRDVSDELKLKILNDYYLPYHQKLEVLVDEALSKEGYVTIIDCHSFSNIPFQRELDKLSTRPDICIGTDDMHTSKWLAQYFANFFLWEGYTVAINRPYNGCIVPEKFYRKNLLVQSIMIEINRKLYMDGNTIVSEKVKKLNILIKDLFSPLLVKR